jgi:hypothetical protein
MPADTMKESKQYSPYTLPLLPVNKLHMRVHPFRAEQTCAFPLVRIEALAQSCRYA